MSGAGETISGEEFWRDVYGRLITDAGMTPREIDELTLDEVYELFAYWRMYPPLRDLVAGFIGFKPNKPVAKPQRSLSIAEIKMRYPDGIIRG